MQNYTTLTSKGQVVIPKEIRDKLNMRPSDRVLIGISGRKFVGQVVPSLKSLRGSVKSKKKFTDAQLEREINRVVSNGMVEDYLKKVESRRI